MNLTTEEKNRITKFVNSIFEKIKSNSFFKDRVWSDYRYGPISDKCFSTCETVQFKDGKSDYSPLQVSVIVLFHVDVMEVCSEVYDISGYDVSSIVTIDLLSHSDVLVMLRGISSEIEALSLELSDSAMKRIEISITIKDLIYKRLTKYFKVEVAQ